MVVSPGIECPIHTKPLSPSLQNLAGFSISSRERQRGCLTIIDAPPRCACWDIFRERCNPYVVLLLSNHDPALFRLLGEMPNQDPRILILRPVHDDGREKQLGGGGGGGLMDRIGIGREGVGGQEKVLVSYAAM